MAQNTNHRYSIVAIILHWVMAILLIFMIWLGWNMDDHEARFQLHKSIGITLLVLTVARILWRVMNPPPPLPDMPARDSKASHLVHMGFYALMLGLPLGGWILVSSSKFHVPTVLFGTISWPHLPFMGPFRTELGHLIVETLHSKGAWLLILLLALHVAGAVKHEISNEDGGVLLRMIPGIFGQTEGVSTQSLGALIAFGGALALFCAIAAIPLLSSGDKSVRPQSTTQTTGNWIVDYPASDIRFSGIHDGDTFTGNFANWTADIQFETSNLPAARANITIASNAAATGKKLYDDTLVGAEWFDTKAHPQITVTVDSITQTDTNYAATAHIELKGQQVAVPFTFDLTIDGDVAQLSGTSTLSRSALDLGQVSDPGADWVSDAVTVDVTLSALRK